MRVFEDEDAFPQALRRRSGIMVFILGISLGITALLLRSAVAIAGVGLLIVAAFIAAAIVSQTGFHLLSLLIALAGYNAGMAGGFAATLVIQQMRTA
jgi:hypothetical protein